MKNREGDRLYASPLDEIVDFSFDRAVVEVFPDMINRSVPGYSTLIDLSGIVAAHCAQPESRLYDLGCSLGAVTLAMRRYLTQPGCSIVAVDNSEEMVARCRQYVADAGEGCPVELRCDDIQQAEIERASVVVLNLTLQFIAPEKRGALLSRIFEGTLPGGVLLLTEKLACDAGEEGEFLVAAHHAFKRANGYSELEISQKRTALENVLIPESGERHQARLREVGFSKVYQWFQCLNFASFVAIK